MLMEGMPALPKDKTSESRSWPFNSVSAIHCTFFKSGFRAWQQDPSASRIFLSKWRWWIFYSIQV